MTWTHFFLAVIGSVIAVSFTDWFFMGFLFHKKYLETPEIWRGQAGQPETKRIIWSTLIGVVSNAALIYACAMDGAPQLDDALRDAVLAWLIGPVPLLSMNVVWMKFHPTIALSHALGWLARFVISALFAVWLLK
jgi:hypothetical protein